MPWKTRTFIEVPHDARRRIERAIAALQLMLEQLDGDDDFNADLEQPAVKPRKGVKQMELSL
jgi:hypothetical protein